MSRDREQLREYLLEMDPEYLCDVLGISSEELVRAFPKKVRDYIDEWADDGQVTDYDDPDEDFEEEEDEYGSGEDYSGAWE